ncbi:MAG: hypothetical protein AAGF15_10655 [Pseudomonadota bacterium]
MGINGFHDLSVREIACRVTCFAMLAWVSLQPTTAFAAIDFNDRKAVRADLAEKANYCSKQATNNRQASVCAQLCKNTQRMLGSPRMRMGYRADAGRHFWSQCDQIFALVAANDPNAPRPPKPTGPQATKARIVDGGNGSIFVSVGDALFTIQKQTVYRPNDPIRYLITGGDKTNAVFAYRQGSGRCTARDQVKFFIDVNSRRDRYRFRKTMAVTANELVIEDFIHAYKAALRHACPNTKAIDFEGQITLGDGEGTKLTYQAKVEAASGWKIQEGTAAGFAPPGVIISFRYRSPDWTVEANVKGDCRDNPVVALTRIQQSTMTKMPTFRDYKRAAAAVAPSYFQRCPDAEVARMSLRPMPHDYSCEWGETCQFTVQRSTPDLVDTGNVKYVRGARNGVPPGGFRTKSEAEIAFETSGLFKDYRAGVYLSALYAGDFTVARTQDRLFSQPYRKLVEGRSGQQLATLMLLPLKGMSMRQAEVDQLAATLQRLNAELSMINTVMATYLFSYPNIYQDCMEPDAPGVVLTTSWREVTTQGGFVVHEGPIETSKRIYRANRRFYKILEAVVGTEPQIVGITDRMLRGSPALSVSDANAGVYRLMRNYRCDSAEIKQLERHLIEYWNDYQKRIGPYLSRLPGYAPSK